ncbi:hypothetical protein [Labrys monachus]|uniref:Uncharacterized protein n=1 Tax=Labrys monachus TaxID=217067 RepID=A0ABU0F8N2_9HYPH|nr:hypothetical protein [Labrys monachus]MDQ0390973.1 hypothetical protein [Labrys monachus]
MEKADDLIDRCNRLIGEGMDFPMIWNSYLKGHRLVLGPPIQSYRNDQPVLRVPLFYRQTLIFMASEAQFAIE